MSRLAGHIYVALLLTLLAGHPAQSEERPASHADASRPTVAPLIKRVMPSCRDSGQARLRRTIESGGGCPDRPLPQEHTVVGSGVIVDADLGLIVTGDHVVENAEAVSVALSDSRRLDARVLATSEGDDLAWIAPGGLAAFSPGDANGLEVGDFVLAIGNPLGRGQSATFGIVSALNRSSPEIANEDLIATDALIERGISGGRLINTRGELVGINVAISRQVSSST